TPVSEPTGLSAPEDAQNPSDDIIPEVTYEDFDQANPPTLQNPLSGLEFELDPAMSSVPTAVFPTEEDDDEKIAEKLRRQGVKLGKGLIAPRVFWPAFIIVLGVAIAS
ncbi:hypothetical protein SB658_22745, partial [Bacillus sp. SIMBA_008]|uniref:hypothetical protein n=1 Tax=Bacillus sp. SIMBA_008 TaxID=3085757 RepID=UPI00397AC591